MVLMGRSREPLDFVYVMEGVKPLALGLLAQEVQNGNDGAFLDWAKVGASQTWLILG